MITQSELKRIWHYDPETGFFTRLVRPKNSRTKVGDIASCHATAGYIVITINKKLYYAHRLAFLYVVGKFPECETDHINGIRDDNRWANLRDVSVTVNQQNQRAAPRTNTSGYTGVVWHKDDKIWRVHIRVNGKRIKVGSFHDPALGGAAYLKAKRELHPGCTI